MARPTTYTQEIADTVCERIAVGQSLRSICDDDAMPALRTVFDWLAREDREDFRTKYARAREAQADSMFDDIIDIADDGRNDWMEKKDSEGETIGWRENGEAMRRSQLRIEARKWMAAKLQPKKYGDKLDLNVSGRLETVPEEQLETRIADLLGKAGVNVPLGREGSPEEDK